MGRKQLLVVWGLTVLSAAPAALGSPTLSITSARSQGFVEVTVTRPGSPAPEHRWYRSHAGFAEADLSLTRSGVFTPELEPYSARAFARVGSGVVPEFAPAFTPIAAMHVLADDSLHAKARAFMGAEWTLRVEGSPVGLDLLAWSEMGHSSGFSLYDLTEGSAVFDSGIVRHSERVQLILEPNRDYHLAAYAAAHFPAGDGGAGFAFGSDATTHTLTLVPEPAGALGAALALACLGSPRRRKIRATQDRNL